MGVVRRFIAATAVLLGTAGLLAAVEPHAAAAAPPAPDRLSLGGDVSRGSPTFGWSSPRKASSYEIQVDDDASFASPEFGTVKTPSVHWVPLTLLKRGTYYWRVRAVTADQSRSPWSDSDPFEVDGVSVPDGLSIDLGDDDVLDQPSEAPLLTWDPVPGAESYVVEVDKGDASGVDYLGALTYKTSVPSLVVPVTLEPVTWSWHVKAIRASGIESSFSADNTFTVASIPPPTNLRVAPESAAESESDLQDVVLDWDAVPGAAYYRVRVSTDDDFSESSLVKNLPTKILGTRFSPAITFDNNQYFWQVQAVDTSDNPTAWSPTAEIPQFRRQWLETPQSVYPAAGDGVVVTDEDLYLQWEPVRHASDYELQMSRDDNFSPGSTFDCRVVGTTYTPGQFRINNTTGQVSPVSAPEECNPVPGLRTYWRVRGLDLPSGVEGQYSETRSFTYRPDTFEVGSTLPADGDTVDVPTLSWRPVDWAAYYTVSITDRTGSTVVSSKKTYATSYTPVTSSPLTAAKSPYTWSLTAFTADGRAASTTRQSTFSVSGTVPTGGTPLQATSGTLADGASSRPPQLSWNPYPGAASYQVFAGAEPSAGQPLVLFAGSTDLFGVKLLYPSVTDTDPQLLQPGRYQWYVKAYDASGAVIATGPTNTVQVSALGSVISSGNVDLALDAATIDAGDGCHTENRVDLIRCDLVPATPVISWSPVENASMYMVYISEDATFTNLLEPLTKIPATSNTYWAPTEAEVAAALPDSEAGGSFWVHIRPCTAAASGRLYCGPSPISVSGQATARFRKTSPPVSLVSPANGDTVLTGAPGGRQNGDEITLDWQDYRDTNDGIDDSTDDHERTVWAETGELGTQSAQQYRVQVDDANDFTSPLETKVVDQSTFTSAAMFYPDGPLYWRVQAIDGDGNDLAWSSPRSFTKTSPAPTGLSPTANPTIPTTVPLTWEARASAASYTVEVYKNDDANFSAANRIISAPKLKQAAYVSADALAPGTYRWRVSKVDPSGNQGPWADQGRFTITASAPTTPSPVGDEFLSADDVLLTWGRVDQAVSYTVTLRSDTSSAPTVTTRAAAYAPTSTLRDGVWTWTVTAKNADGAVLGSSGGSFTIDATGPAIVKKSPTKITPTSTFTATLGERAKGVSTKTVQLFAHGTRRPLAAKVQTSAGGTKVIVKPKQRLKKGTSYAIRFSKKITDVHGNPMSPVDWNFYVPA